MQPFLYSDDRKLNTRGFPQNLYFNNFSTFHLFPDTLYLYPSTFKSEC